MLQIMSKGGSRNMTRVVCCAVLVLFAALAAKTPGPSFYVEEAIDLIYEPLAGMDVIYPSSLTDISALYQKEDYRQVIMRLTRIYKMNVPDGDRAAVLLMLAESCRKLNLKEESNQYLNELIAGYPESPYRPLALYRIQNYYYSQKQYSLCDSVGEITEKQYPGHSVYGKSLYVRAKGLIHKKKYKEAISAAQRIPKTSEMFLAGNFVTGLCYIATGNSKKGLVFLDHVASKGGNSVLANEACIIEGDLYYQMGHYKTALKIYSQIDQTFDKIDYVEMRIAQTYMKLKEYDKAIELASRLIPEYPDKEYIFEACVLLSECYKETGNSHKAMEVKEYADKYARNFRTLFMIFSEVRQLEMLNRQLSDIERKTLSLYKNNGRDTELFRQIEERRIKNMRKRLLSILEQVDPSGRQRRYVSTSGISEQRYLEILNYDIKAAVRDSADLYTEIQVGYLDLDTMSDSADIQQFKKKVVTWEQSYKQLVHRLENLRGLKSDVITECASTESASRFTENMQATYIDWALVQMGEIKTQIQETNQAIIKENEKIRKWKEAMKPPEKAKQPVSTGDANEKEEADKSSTAPDAAKGKETEKDEKKK